MHCFLRSSDSTNVRVFIPSSFRANPDPGTPAALDSAACRAGPSGYPMRSSRPLCHDSEAMTNTPVNRRSGSDGAEQAPTTGRPLWPDVVVAVVVFALEIVGVLSRAENESGEFSLVPRWLCSVALYGVGTYILEHIRLHRVLEPRAARSVEVNQREPRGVTPLGVAEGASASEPERLVGLSGVHTTRPLEPHSPQ